MSDNFNTICRIADRAEKLYARLGLLMPTDRMGLIMDIEYTDRVCPLDLEGWLAADDQNFSHDLGGILKNFNRVTHVLDNYFTPRYAMCNFAHYEPNGEPQLRGMAES